MNPKRRAAAPPLIGILLTGLWCGCGNAPTYTPFISWVGQPGYSVPVGTTDLDVSGSFFDPSTVVFWNGRKQTTHYLSSKSLRIVLDPGLTDSASQAQVTAQNEGSPLSAPFVVNVFRPSFQMTAVSPRQIALGAADTAISIGGSGFRATDVALWNGVPLATTMQSATALVATVPAALLAIAGDGFVQVSDPGCTAYCMSRSTGLAVAVGASSRKTLYRALFDIAWDATDSLLLASISQGGGDSSVGALDPVSGAIVQSTASEKSRTQLAVSDQDAFVYAFSPVGSSPPTTVEPKRFALPALSGGVTLTGFPTTSFFGSPPAMQTLAPAPGSPTTVAIVTDAVRIVDDTVARPMAGSGVAAIEWGFDASTLYGLAQLDPGIVLFTVDGSGITSRRVLGTTLFGPYSRLHYDRITRRLYGDSGENVDEQGLDPRPFAVLVGRTANCLAAIDGALGKAFYACNDPDFGFVVKSFDLATQRPIANILLGPSVGEPQRIIRTGSDGLAVAADGTLYIYGGPFVH